MLKAPAGETAGQKYTVLLYAFLDLQQSAIDARTAEIKTEIEAEWKVRLRLNDGEVEHLAWAVCVMQLTELKEKSSHSDVAKEKKIGKAHQRIDNAVQKLTSQLSQLVEFSWPSENVSLHGLLAALNSYTAARAGTDAALRPPLAS